MRSARLPLRNRARASEILQKSRPSDNIGALGVEEVGRYRTRDDIDFLKNLIDRYDGVGYARAVAARHAARAARSFQRIEPMLTPSSHTDFLRGLVEFVVGRASLWSCQTSLSSSTDWVVFLSNHSSTRSGVFMRAVAGICHPYLVSSRATAIPPTGVRPRSASR